MWHQDGVMPSLVPGPYHKKRQQVAVTKYTKWHWMVGCCIFGIWSIDKHWSQHQTNKRCFFPQQRPPVFAHFHGSLHQRDLGIHDGRRTVEKVNRWLSRWFVILESSTKNRSCSELLGAGKCAFSCQVFIFLMLKLSWNPATESFPCGCNILQVCCRNFWGRGLLWPILFVFEGILGLPMQMAVFLNGGPMEIAVGGHRCCDAIPGWWSKGCYLWNEDVNPNWNWLILVTVVNLWKSLGP